MAWLYILNPLALKVISPIGTIPFGISPYCTAAIVSRYFFLLFSPKLHGEKAEGELHFHL